MLPILVGLIVWGSFVAITFVKLGSQTKSRNLPPQTVSDPGDVEMGSADDDKKRDRCYSNQIQSAYADAVSGGQNAEDPNHHARTVDFNPFVNDTKYLSLVQR